MEFSAPKEIAALVDIDKKLVESNNLLITAFTQLSAYVFSSKIRPILFAVTAPIERERVVDSDLDPKLQSLRQKVLALNSGTEEFYSAVKKVKLSQQRHEKMVLRYLATAIHNQKLILESVDTIIYDLKDLRQNLDSKYMKTRFHSIKDCFERILELSKKDSVLIADFQGRVRVDSYLLQRYEDLMNNNILNKDNPSKFLQNGDIIVSFKTSKFLKKEYVSRWITYFSGSQVTHVGMFVRDSRGEPMMIHSTFETKYRMHDFSIKPGEMFMVFRPKLSKDQRINLFSAVRARIAQKPSFSVLKLAGVLPSIFVNFLINLFSFRFISSPNVFSAQTSKMFCSEFLNEVFKDVGFYLTPKSEHSNMVFPADVVVSPNIEFIGLLFRDEERTREKIMAELVEGVRI